MSTMMMEQSWTFSLDAPDRKTGFLRVRADGSWDIFETCDGEVTRRVIGGSVFNPPQIVDLIEDWRMRRI